MIECIFTIDYEIYGNGKGSVRDVVYEPTKRLMSVFMERRASFVVFAEALEFMKIEEHRSDEGIGRVREQLHELLEKGFEIGLHLHPWWWNAKRANGDWHLEWNERNLCEMPEQRIDDVVRSSIEYLRVARALAHSANGADGESAGEIRAASGFVGFQRRTNTRCGSGLPSCYAERLLLAIWG
jgi:hypothetical protein